MIDLGTHVKLLGKLKFITLANDIYNSGANFIDLAKVYLTVLSWLLINLSLKIHQKGIF